MEHSALHALELIGLVMALGGVFFMVGVLGPVRRRLGAGQGSSELAAAFELGATRWIWRGALLAAAATFLGLFVDVAEAQGLTVFSGVSPSLTWEFAWHTHVGRLAMARLGALVLMAFASRLRGEFKWWLTGAIGLAVVMLTGLVSHAAAQPVGRWPMVIAEAGHIAAAALWVGVLIQFLAARAAIEGSEGAGGLALLTDLVGRFSPVALAMTSLLGLSGLLMIFRYLGEFGAVPTSAYGMTLIIKMLALLPAIYAGWVNFWVIKPRLANLVQRGDATDASASVELRRKFGKLLELEVTSGILVVVVAGILASVSPPGEEGSYRATAYQMHAMMWPRMPAVDIVNPATFYGAEMRGVDDLKYAEFTHHWSGVMVLLLGCGWLGQSFGGRTGRWSGQTWPFLLVPFAGFVAVAADPEVWLLHKVSFHEVISDPQLLEHQLGAVMILLLVWLGAGDLKKPEENRPLGYALPGILIAGGILLLGHAHSTLTITEGVVNLINLEHAVFGAFILLAGVTRWLSLRDLVPRPAANLIWPCLIIGLGVFMAFFYREVE